MKISKKATSIAESLVVTVIIVLGLTGSYNIFVKSIGLTESVENKIQAIHIAREGIEAITNTVETNWLLYPSNKENCWLTQNYSTYCMSFPITTFDSPFKLYRNSIGRWEVDWGGAYIGQDYTDDTYRNFYKVGLTANGTYTQSGAKIVTDLNPIFTRKIHAATTEAIIGDTSTNTDGFHLKSIVNWKDSSSDEIREVVLETILTNYKNKD